MLLGKTSLKYITYLLLIHSKVEALAEKQIYIEAIKLAFVHSSQNDCRPIKSILSDRNLAIVILRPTGSHNGIM